MECRRHAGSSNHLHAGHIGPCPGVSFLEFLSLQRSLKSLSQQRIQHTDEIKKLTYKLRDTRRKLDSTGSTCSNNLRKMQATNALRLASRVLGSSIDPKTVVDGLHALINFGQPGKGNGINFSQASCTGRANPPPGTLHSC